MIVPYRNNRLVPAVIIAICIGLMYYLIDPSVGSNGRVYPEILEDPSQHSEHHVDAPAQNKTASDTSAVAEEPPASTQSFKDVPLGEQLTKDDVLLIVKTGGTTMWKRLLVHLTTTLASERVSPDNVVVYSDYPETIGRFDIIDVLANMTDSAKAMPDFDVYRDQPEYMANNFYAEAAGVNGDEWGPTGGWIIDKYKFVPLMQHAGENWPAAKWYIYMEDDSYLFLPNLITYLATFDWRKPQYLGSYAAKSDVVFAHGGAGFAVSRGAWEASFGKNSNLTEEYYEYTADHCCGDQVLAHALGKYGVKFGENGGDEKFTWGFNPVVHWTFAFSMHNWCHPLLSWHKVHNRDVCQYYELEKAWDFSKPLLHRDFFSQMILPNIQKPLEWWDNMANLYEVTSANKDVPPHPEDEYDADLWNKAWESVEACSAACTGWANCIQWTYVEDLCKMDDKMIMGQGFASAMSQRKTSLKHTSGWVPERLEKWACV
ncbi:glycosyltransferase family 31 protein [Dactylonectria estremocensis]|uniref:N-acetylgalactosaminide beta-1,3-galactosyltransferase n=1 Tax=Dactylonectria estremocensis TaxID=1079267 RepID=A0A9P9IP15_9HYPO|nr:glycosyltransferase family 31 protein [Dactylonectria estremocensis]